MASIKNKLVTGAAVAALYNDLKGRLFKNLKDAKALGAFRSVGAPEESNEYKIGEGSVVLGTPVMGFKSSTGPDPATKNRVEDLAKIFFFIMMGNRGPSPEEAISSFKRDVEGKFPEGEEVRWLTHNGRIFTREELNINFAYLYFVTDISGRYSDFPNTEIKDNDVNEAFRKGIISNSRKSLETVILNQYNSIAAEIDPILNLLVQIWMGEPVEDLHVSPEMINYIRENYYFNSNGDYPQIPAGVEEDKAYGNKSIGSNSLVAGGGNIAINNNSLVFGKYNQYEIPNPNYDPNIADSPKNIPLDAVEIVGNGLGETNRSNIRTMDKNGNLWLKGDIRVGGDSYETGSSLGSSFKNLKDGNSANSVISNLDMSKKYTVGAGSLSLGGYTQREEIANSTFLEDVWLFSVINYGYTLEKNSFVYSLKDEIEANFQAFTNNNSWVLPMLGIPEGSQINLNSKYKDDHQKNLFLGLLITYLSKTGMHSEATTQEEFISSIRSNLDAAFPSAHLTHASEIGMFAYTQKLVDNEKNAFIEAMQGLISDSILNDIKKCASFNKKVQLGDNQGSIALGNSSLAIGKSTSVSLGVPVETVKTDNPAYYTPPFDPYIGPFEIMSRGSKVINGENYITFRISYDVAFASDQEYELIAASTGSTVAILKNILVDFSDISYDRLTYGDYYVKSPSDTFAWDPAEKYIISLKEQSGLNIALGDNSVAIGVGNRSYESSIAAGIANETKGPGCTSLGSVNKTSGLSSMAQGGFNEATGNYSTACGFDNKALGNSSHAEGNKNLSKGDISHAEGYGTITKGIASHAEGSNTLALEVFSHAEGMSGSHGGIGPEVHWLFIDRESWDSINSTYGSIIIEIPKEEYSAGTEEDPRESISGIYKSDVIRMKTKPKLYSDSVVIPDYTYMILENFSEYTSSSPYDPIDPSKMRFRLSLSYHDSWDYTPSGGLFTKAAAETALQRISRREEIIVWKCHSGAIGKASHVEGINTIAFGDYQHVSGINNIPGNQYLEIIGNGEYDKFADIGEVKRSNARELDLYGNETLAGSLTASQLYSSGARISGDVSIAKNLSTNTMTATDISIKENSWSETEGDIVSLKATINDLLKRIAALEAAQKPEIPPSTPTEETPTV